MTNLENLFQEREELIKDTYSSKEEYMEFLKKEGFQFLFFRNLEKDGKEFYFFKVINNKIHFISFINYTFPSYNSFYIEDITFFKIYTDAFKVILKNDKTFYIGSRNNSINSEKEIQIGFQILVKILSNFKKYNKSILNL